LSKSYAITEGKCYLNTVPGKQPHMKYVAAEIHRKQKAKEVFVFHSDKVPHTYIQIYILS